MTDYQKILLFLIGIFSFLSYFQNRTAKKTFETIHKMFLGSDEFIKTIEKNKLQRTILFLFLFGLITSFGLFVSSFIY